MDNVDTASYSVLPFSPSQARQPLNEDVPTYRIARVHGLLSANDEIVPIGESVESLTTLDSCVLLYQDAIRGIQSSLLAKQRLSANG